MSRYHVDCDPGQYLSYSILVLSLEEKGTCSDNGDPECLDFLKIQRPNPEPDRILCGNQNFTNEFVLDNPPFQMEFHSNRINEGSGFVLVVTCAPRGSTSSNNNKRAAYYGTKPQTENCSFPPHKENLKPGVIKLLVSNTMYTIALIM